MKIRLHWRTILQDSTQPDDPNLPVTAAGVRQQHNENLEEAAQMEKENLKEDAKEVATCDLNEAVEAVKSDLKYASADILASPATFLDAEAFVNRAKEKIAASLRDITIETQPQLDTEPQLDIEALAGFWYDLFEPLRRLFEAYVKPKNKLDVLYQTKFAAVGYSMTNPEQVDMNNMGPCAVYVLRGWESSCFSKKAKNFLVLDQACDFRSWARHSAKGYAAHKNNDSETMAIVKSANSDQAVDVAKLSLKLGIKAASIALQGGFEMVPFGDMVSLMMDSMSFDIWFPGKPDLSRLESFDFFNTNGSISETIAEVAGIEIPEEMTIKEITSQQANNGEEEADNEEEADGNEADNMDAATKAVHDAAQQQAEERAAEALGQTGEARTKSDGKMEQDMEAGTKAVHDAAQQQAAANVTVG